MAAPQRELPVPRGCVTTTDFTKIKEEHARGTVASLIMLAEGEQAFDCVGLAPAGCIRQVPCPGCHKRDGDEKEFSLAVAHGRGTIHYASPASAEPDARWTCGRCAKTSSWSAEQVMPGPHSSGGLAGRAWEQVVERHVLHLDAKVEEAEESADTSGSSSSAIEAEAIQLHELVARSLGSKHWTTVRLVGILSRMDVM